MSKYDVDIGRPNKWGNCFATKNSKFPCYKCNTVPEAVGCYARWITDRLSNDMDLKADLQNLRGKRLACWCNINQLCHGVVLMALAEDQSIQKFCDLVTEERYAAILAAGMR